ncbi:EF-hand domain-containing protein [Paracraurococcus lichenis]|uniref:EF-hand domain-containing protein n=1 Tax=Paracraurococcus lichenis TaxID=3064888 RepID=A0ABT9E4Y9_9PROT|nr:EF-hand domain-containing protein [Paracraurococcus sp. LOR1-02]MDO9711234.1 EF-hand domain-containing protein [Paracraurococcus sp. LOR1-02]
MTPFRTALLGTALLAAAAAPALAQPAPGQAGPGPRGAGAMFNQFDTNKDGRVTWDEAWAVIQQRFNAADPDHDGSLTQQEMAKARLRPNATRPEGGQGPQRERMVGMMFRALDANRDGVVTLEEIRPAAEARFRAFDANGDGAVTRDEVPAPPRRQHRGTGGQPPAQQPG